MVSGCLRAGLLLLYCFIAAAAADATTTTVSVISTVTDYRGACDNFSGACVVYGTYSGAPYTTTVYHYSPSTTALSTTTVTATVLRTTTVSNGADCQDFTGACVVYGGTASATTVYYPGSSHTSVGNGEGYIGQKNGGGGEALVDRAKQVYKLLIWITGAALAGLAIAFLFD